MLALLTCIHTVALAEHSHPETPSGWIVGESKDPIILTWIKAHPEKDLDTVPHFLIQKFPKAEKFEKFVKEKPLDKNSCRDLKEGEWTQTWCLKKKNIFVILSKNHDSEFSKIKRTLRSWVLAHE